MAAQLAGGPAAHGGEWWGTHTVSLCSTHKAPHKGHKAGDKEERALTAARAPCTSWLKAGQLPAGQRAQLVT